MLMQLSSGDGPAECELAVEKCFAALQREFPEIVLADRKAGSVRGGSGSIRFRVPEAAGEAVRGLRALSGTIQWICPSPLRPHHRRKNWFISLREIEESAGPDRSGPVRMDRFRSGGKGGQNVNKVETGVRLTHAGANISVRVTSQRSQLQNRREAEARLEAAFERLENDARKETEADAWMKNKNLERGRAVRVYEGLGFRLLK